MTLDPARMPTKLQILQVLLNRGSVFVHFDPRKPGSLIPLHLRDKYQVVLQIGLNMPVPIPDLSYSDDHIVGTLSFKGNPFKVRVPMSAVFALVGEDAKGMVWNADMPAEVKAEQEAAERAAAAPEPTNQDNVVKLDTSRSASKSHTKKPSKSGADRSHLKLVQ
jgi:stringent starvation protein B